MATEEAWRQELEQKGVEVFHYNTPAKWEGASLWSFITNGDYHWLRNTQRSFIGMFAFMNISLHQGLYYIYYACFGIGICLYAYIVAIRKKGEGTSLFFVLLMSSIITLGLSMYQSFYRDYQAQGRYIISVIVLFAYMIAFDNDKLSVCYESKEGEALSNKKLKVDVFFCCVWILMFIKVFLEFISQMFIK